MARVLRNEFAHPGFLEALNGVVEVAFGRAPVVGEEDHESIFVLICSFQYGLVSPLLLCFSFDAIVELSGYAPVALLLLEYK